jgi:glycosyltransferase involved in cell wall biosynthesis
MKRVLWIGPVVGPDTLQRWRALSPAANRWQASFIAALHARGHHVDVLGHVSEPLWPRGVLRMSGHTETLTCGTASLCVPYLNVPAARPWALRQAYVRGFRRALSDGEYDVAVTYNITTATHAVGRLALDQGMPWVAIVADTPVGSRAVRVHNHLAAAASGRLYLSWGSYEEGVEPCLHLDGGIDRVRPHGRVRRAAGEPAVILYAGSVAGYAGVRLLVEAFLHCRHDRELWICGKGNDAAVAAAATRDPRIRCFGFVTEEELEELSLQTDVFVNPRGSAGNQGNFPSKVLEYLTYLKPVVSTWTAGLSPAYRDVLEVCEAESAVSLAATIEDALQWDDERRARYAGAVERFLLETRRWSRQAERFDDWLTESVIHDDHARRGR